jgi:LysM repeat protein
MPFGCSSVSDEEMGRLREETYALEAELAAARQEAVILDRVLTSVYQERDKIVDQINKATAEASGKEIPSLSATAPNETAPAAPARAGVYRAKVGDTLSSIAQRHGTTIQALLELNPFIAARPSRMVWVDDDLVLPAN